MVSLPDLSSASASVRVLGRYALYDAIASGGMATVHLGRLLGHVGFARTVAVKRLHAQYAGDPEFVAMFLDEARLAARIRHPNVVPTIDVVATEGELFLVMEYVQGESLSRLLRLASAADERIPPEYACAIVAGTLHGLHAAHEATNENGMHLGIVHRDVSPQNILVGIDGAPRVLDFGVAKAAGRVQTTSEGTLKGKVSYMPPEQIRGKVTRVTDVYAASVVLWEALTGGRLFTGENQAEIIHKILSDPIEPPSTYAPGLPAALDAVVLRGLARDPADRFPTAKAMALALEQAMPLVSASAIGEWVERLGKRSLADRADLVARIESVSSNVGRQTDSESPLGIASELSSDRRKASSDAPTLMVDSTRSELSSASLSIARKELSTARRRLAVLVPVAGVAVIALSILGARFLHGSSPAITNTPPSASSTTVLIATSAPTAAVTSPPEIPSSHPASSTTAEAPPPAPSSLPQPVPRKWQSGYLPPQAPLHTKPATKTTDGYDGLVDSRK